MSSTVQAEWAINEGIDMTLDNDLLTVYEDAEPTDRFVETDKKSLQAAEESVTSVAASRTISDTGRSCKRNPTVHGLSRTHDPRAALASKPVVPLK